MKLTVSAVLLLAAVAGAASASSEVVSAPEQKTHAALRHRKLAGRKNKKTPADKMRTRKLGRKRTKETKVAENNQGGKNKANKKAKDADTGTKFEGSAATSRNSAINRSQYGNPNGRKSYPYSKGDTGAAECNQSSNANPYGNTECQSFRGVVGITKEMYALFGCTKDSECQSGCCFNGNFMFGFQIAPTGGFEPTSCCLDVDATSAGDNGCQSPFTSPTVPVDDPVSTINNNGNTISTGLTDHGLRTP